MAVLVVIEIIDYQVEGLHDIYESDNWTSMLSGIVQVKNNLA